MSSTTDSITWKSWSRKWGDWNTWYPVKVDPKELNPSSRKTTGLRVNSWIIPFTAEKAIHETTRK